LTSKHASGVDLEHNEKDSKFRNGKKKHQVTPVKQSSIVMGGEVLEEASQSKRVTILNKVSGEVRAKNTYGAPAISQKETRTAKVP